MLMFRFRYIFAYTGSVTLMVKDVPSDRLTVRVSSVLKASREVNSQSLPSFATVTRLVSENTALVTSSTS